MSSRGTLEFKPAGYGADTAHWLLRLMYAVLEDGIRTLLRNSGTKHARAAHRWRQEFRWLSSRDRSHLFAYENICQALDIDPGRLRRRVLNAALSGGLRGAGDARRRALASVAGLAAVTGVGPR